MLKAELDNERHKRLIERASIERMVLSERLEKEAIQKELLGLRKRLSSQNQPIGSGDIGEASNPLQSAKL